MTTSPGPTRKTFVTFAVLIALATFGKQLMWASIVPVGQHPDEQVHAVYADDLARGGGWTTSNRIASRALEQTLTNSGFLDVIFAPDAISSMDDEELRARSKSLGAVDPQARKTTGTHGSTASAYPPASYALYAAAISVTNDEPYVTSFFAERLVSALLATITSVVHFLLFLQVLRSLWIATSAALFLTMMPMYSAIEASINPDVLLNLCGAVILLVLAKIVREPARWPLHLGIGVALAVAMLTKPAALALFVPYAVSMLVTRRHPSWSTRTRLRAGLAGLLPTTVAYGGWRIASLGSEEISADPLAHLPGGTLGASAVSEYGRFLLREGRFRFGEMFWGVFGWLDTPMPDWYLTAGWYALVVLAVLVIARMLLAPPPAWVVVFMSAIGAVAAMLLFVELRVHVATGIGMVQGRYFFCVLAAIVACWYWAISWVLARHPRIRATAFAVLPVTMLASQLVAILRTIIPRYYL